MLKFTILYVLSIAFSSTICAQFHGRIVGGTTASVNQFPYQVSLQLNENHLCGGAIYNKYYIITAAHCVLDTDGNVRNPDNFKIIAGVINLDDQNKKLLAIGKIIVHEKYKPNKYNQISINDIALVKLKAPLDLSTTAIKKIELYAGRKLQQQQTVIVSGWGKTSNTGTSVSNELKYAELTTITPRQCYRATGIYSTKLLCLAHPKGRSACSGDSGGPATYDGKLVGIAAFGDEDCESNAPNGYTRISEYRIWIKKNSL